MMLAQRQQSIPHSTPQQAPISKPTAPSVQPDLESQKRDKERVELIMKINQSLLVRATKFQEEGNSVELENLKQKGPAPQNAQDFIKIMRSMQANLSYISSMMQKGKYTFPGPAIMDCPLPADPEMTNMYAQLPRLFGEWKGQSGLKGLQDGPAGQAQRQTQLQTA